MATLDFIVLKINNNEISKIPKNEAVQMFLYSEEPLFLEVRRKHLSTADINSQYNINTKLEKLNISNDTNNLAINSASKTLLIENELVLTLNTITNVSTDITKTHTKTTQTDSEYIFALDHHLTKENAERIVEQEHNLFEQCLESEIDIEEITLRKSSSNERLGLTVCYSSVYSNNASSGNINNNHGTLSGLEVNEMCTDVYISDIQPDSVAGRDGRLRQGDQILQINGKDIKNKEETEALIAENNNAVTLLVSRYLYADEDDFNDPCCIVEINEGVGVDGDDDDDDELEFDDRNYLSYENGFLINNSKQTVENHELSRNNATLELGKIPLENLESKNCSENIKIHNSTIPSSKASTKCTTSSKTASTLIIKENSIKNKFSNKESSDTQKYKLEPQKSTKSNLYHFKPSTSKKPQTFQSNINYEVEHIYETIPEDSESEPFYCSPYETSMYLTAVGSCSSSTATDAIQMQQQKQRVAQWLGIKNHALPISNQRQMARCSNGNGRILNKTETVRSAVTIATSGSSSSGGLGVGSTSVAATEKRIISQEDHENSSSAYNTGGSNNSATKLVIGTTQSSDVKQKGDRVDRTQILREKSNTIKNNCLFIGKENSQLDANITELLEKNQNQQSSSKILLHTNDTNLSQSTQQQQIVKQTQSNQSKQSDHQFTAPNLSQYHFVSSQEVSTISHTVATIPTNNQKTDEQMVWKVKRRPDGTRYIVRRPARKCVLKERTLHLSSHIPHYTTTEDDTISEVKIGKYWPKEERKKHIERARERRLHQQQYQQEITPTFKSTLAIGDKAAHKLQSQRLRNIRQEDAQLQYHRQHQNYFQLQFNSANSFQQSLDGFPCQQPDLTPVESAVDTGSRNDCLPVTNNGLDATLVTFPAKLDQVQSENVITFAKMQDVNTLSNDQIIQITTESNKPNNLLSITTS